jgi:methyl-accepting chemotaxis protein
MLKDMTIKSRLILVIGLLSLLLIGVGGLGMYGTNQSNMALKSVYEDRMIPAVQLGKILDVWYQVRKNAIDAAESKDIIVARKLAEEANKLVKQNEGIWAQYLATNLIPEEVALTKTKGEQHVQYVQSMNQTFQLAMAGEFEAAVQNVKTDTAKKFSVLRDTVFTLLELQGSAVAKEYAFAKSHYESNFIIASFMITIGVLLAMIIGFLLMRAIVKPLNEAIAVANAVASGDLTSRIEANSTNETGRLLQALKTMNDNLADLVGKVR